MALTSTTGTVDGDSVTFYIPFSGNSRGEGIIAYADFTYQTNTLLQFSFKDSDIDDTNYYKQIYLDSNFYLTDYEMTLTASGYFRIPIQTALNEESIRIDVSNLTTGDLNIEFNYDQPYT